jgi:hypothetical protein
MLEFVSYVSISIHSCSLTHHWTQLHFPEPVLPAHCTILAHNCSGRMDTLTAHTFSLVQFILKASHRILSNIHFFHPPDHCTKSRSMQCSWRSCTYNAPPPHSHNIIFAFHRRGLSHFLFILVCKKCLQIYTDPAPLVIIRSWVWQQHHYTSKHEQQKSLGNHPHRHPRPVAGGALLFVCCIHCNVSFIICVALCAVFCLSVVWYVYFCVVSYCSNTATGQKPISSSIKQQKTTITCQ